MMNLAVSKIKDMGSAKDIIDNSVGGWRQSIIYNTKNIKILTASMYKGTNAN